MPAFLVSNREHGHDLVFTEDEARKRMEALLLELQETGYYNDATIRESLSYLRDLWDEGQDFTCHLDGYTFEIDVRDSRVARIIAPPDKVRPYLPSNYVVADGDENYTIIEGFDSHGWTLDGYVLPRLASGMYRGEEEFPNPA